MWYGQFHKRNFYTQKQPLNINGRDKLIGGDKMNKTLCLVAICILLITKTAIAETPVEIISDTPDSAGQRLVFAAKERIRASSSLGIYFDQTVPRMQVRIVTLDQSPSNPGYSTVYSVVFLWNNPKLPFPIYLSQRVGYCGSKRVDECADRLVANIAEESEPMARLDQRQVKPVKKTKR